MKLFSLNLFICSLILVSLTVIEKETANAVDNLSMETELNQRKKTTRQPNHKLISKKDESITSKKTKTTWKISTLKIHGYPIKVLHISQVNLNGLEKFIELADRSTDSAKPKKSGDYEGIIRKNDYIAINQNVMYWFSATPKNAGRVTKSGGGLLAGAWEIKLDPQGYPSYINIDKNNYIPNNLLPGSGKGTKTRPGSLVYGGYPKIDVTWGIANAADVTPGKKMGKEILSLEKGPFSEVDGVFLEFTGTITNKGSGPGIDSPTDTDPRPGINGRTKYILTYRIPAKSPEIIQEIQFAVEENNFGPISSAFLALNLPGYDGKDLSYATDTELIKTTPEINLENVEINKYFTTKCAKNVYFYQMKSVEHKGKTYVTQTAPGAGIFGCIGSPEKLISFACGYPNNEYIPKSAYEEYALVFDDNQAKGSPSHSLTYKLLSTEKRTITMKKGDTMILVMRYKFIDARRAVYAKKVYITKPAY